MFGGWACAEKELSKTKKEVIRLEAERRSLLEDLYEVKDSKKQADRVSREQKKKLDVLEREVQFYREQASQAISERDNMKWEVQNQRKKMTELMQDVEGMKEQRDELSTERDVLQQQLQEANHRCTMLEQAATRAESIPSLEKQLKDKSNQIQRLQRDLEGVREEKDGLIDTNKDLTQQLADRERQWRAASEDQTTSLQNKLQELLQSLECLNTELTDVTQQKVSALMRLSDAENDLSRARQEMVILRSTISTLKEELGAAAEEKVKALMQVAEVQGASSRSSSRNATPVHSPIKRTA